MPGRQASLADKLSSVFFSLFMLRMRLLRRISRLQR